MTLDTTGSVMYCWGHDPIAVQSLKRKVLCRVSELSLLLSLSGERSHRTPPAVFVYGHTATGKTYVMETLLKTLLLPSVFVNCVECFSARFLYEHILTNLPSGGSCSLPPTSAACDNMNDFVRSLVVEVSSRHLEEETLYIVLDKAERLRDMDVNILPAFLKLQELTGLNICVILISEVIWEKFRCGTGFQDPFIINMPDFSLEQVKEIMQLDCPEGHSPALYDSYIDLFLSVFYCVCRDLRELKHMALLNYSNYIAPVKKGEASENDLHKLWRNFEPHLKEALRTLYLREVSSSQWKRMQQCDEDDDDGVGLVTANTALSRNHVELPYYSKYLLLSAYLASYNPVSSDRCFFCTRTQKVRKRKKLGARKRDRASSHLLGPKLFPLDRLLAIFYSIVEDRVAPSAVLFSQISSLVSLHLLGQSNSSNRLDSPHYKCLVSLDLIRSVARTINFDIMRYLYDFM